MTNYMSNCLLKSEIIKFDPAFITFAFKKYINNIQQSPKRLIRNILSICFAYFSAYGNVEVQ